MTWTERAWLNDFCHNKNRCDNAKIKIADQNQIRIIDVSSNRYKIYIIDKFYKQKNYMI